LLGFPPARPGRPLGLPLLPPSPRAFGTTPRADEVVEAGGESAIWIAEPATAAQEREIANGLQIKIAAEYLAIAAEARQAGAQPAGRHRRTLSRLRRELHRIRRRDYFPPSERDDAEAAVAALGERLEELAA
jgi:hypothetical protein